MNQYRDRILPDTLVGMGEHQQEQYRQGQAAARALIDGVNVMTNENFGLLIITHYERILTYIKPTHLHILIEGQIVVSGGPNLVSSSRPATRRRLS